MSLANRLMSIGSAAGLAAGLSIDAGRTFTGDNLAVMPVMAIWSPIENKGSIFRSQFRD